MIYSVNNYDKIRDLFQCRFLPTGQIDGLMQERHSFIANALELRPSCTNPLKYNDMELNI